jgi:hypothetical protein
MVPLNRITLGPTISDYNNQIKTLSKFPFPLNEASFKDQDLLKQTTLTD